MPRFNEDENNKPINFDLLLSYLNDAYRMLYAAYQDLVIEKKVKPYERPEKAKTWHIENFITEDLVDLAEVKSIREGLNLEWDDQSKTTKRKYVDISITYGLNLGRNKRLRIECKHFINNESNKKYVENGMNRFQTGHYSHEMPVGGMLGYIENNEVTRIVKSINDKLDFSVLTPYQFQSKIPNSYISNLDRSDVSDCISDFKLYHVFLDFRNLIKRD